MSTETYNTLENFIPAMPELHRPKNLHLFRAQPIFGQESKNIAKLRQKMSRNWLKVLKTQDFSLHLFHANTTFKNGNPDRIAVLFFFCGLVA